MTSICAVSDLHGALPRIPESDILVVAGDISPIQYDRDVKMAMNWFENEFSEWIRATPTKYRLFIAGNHDFMIRDNLQYFQQYIDAEDMQFLHDSGVEIEGIKFYGLGWIPNLVNWPFYGDNEKLAQVYGAVPEDTDVVISHGPFIGELDKMDYYDYHMGMVKKNVGARQANDMLKHVQPDYFFCGHIHEGYGYQKYHDKTHCYNVAIMNVDYDPVNKPVVIDL